MIPTHILAEEPPINGDIREFWEVSRILKRKRKFEIVASLRSSIWNTRFSHICVITSSYRKKDETWLSLRPVLSVYMPSKLAIVCDNGHNGRIYLYSSSKSHNGAILKQDNGSSYMIKCLQVIMFYSFFNSKSVLYKCL